METTDKIEIDRLIRLLDNLKTDLNEVHKNVAILSSKIDYQKEHSASIIIKNEEFNELVEVIKNEIHTFREDVHNISNQHKLLIEQGFPNGDLFGHRSFHTTEMAERKEAQEIKKEVKSHILKGIIWALAVAMFLSVIISIKEWVKK